MKILFETVNKNYGLISALKNIDLEINPGEFLFIVGPSGAGKSTLLKLILKQTKPSSGKVLIDEIDINHSKRNWIEKIRKKIGVVFQDYQLINDKSIEENISLALDIVSYPKKDIPARTDEMIKKVNLQSRRFLFPSQLSGGELQRAALARALSVQPEIILADEPTGNLDLENSWNLVRLLKDINHSLGTTIIMTTHNLDIVESLKERVIEIRNGQITTDSSKVRLENSNHK